MVRKDILLYTTLGVLLIETAVIAWAFWNKKDIIKESEDKNVKKD